MYGTVFSFFWEMFNAKTSVYIICLGDCDRNGEIVASATDGSGFRFPLLCLPI